MRHRVGKKKLNRSSSHRRALLRGLTTAMVEHEYVVTTLAKAKFFKPYVEKLVTQAKVDTSFTTIARLKAKLYTDIAARKLTEDIAPRYKDRSGGYTRIVKLGFRDGDKAPLARIEFVKEESDKKVTKSNKPTKAVEPKVTKKGNSAPNPTLDNDVPVKAQTSKVSKPKQLRRKI